MKMQSTRRRWAWAGLLVAATSVIVGLGAVIGCQSYESTAGAGTEQAPTTQTALGLTVPQKSGAQLWAEDCAHCHNLRSPASFSAAQWGMIVMHMQLRADLPGEDAKAISDFLQAGGR